MQDLSDINNEREKKKLLEEAKWKEEEEARAHAREASEDS